MTTNSKYDGGIRVVYPPSRRALRRGRHVRLGDGAAGPSALGVWGPPGPALLGLRRAWAAELSEASYRRADEIVGS